MSSSISVTPRIALFPGTFDPLTLGHTNIIERARKLFDKIYVGIGSNQAKQPMFSAAQRQEWIERVFAHDDKVACVVYTDLTIECCKRVGANFIIRGLRYTSDFEYEKSIADTNYVLNNEVETVIFTCSPKYHFITSSIVRDMIVHNHCVKDFVPSLVSDNLITLLGQAST